MCVCGEGCWDFFQLGFHLKAKKPRSPRGHDELVSKSWWDCPYVVKINWHSVRPHKAGQSLCFAFSSCSGHRQKSMSDRYRVLCSRLILPVAKPLEEFQRFRCCLMWGSCNTVLFTLLRSAKWGPGDHWNHRIIFYLLYRFFWPKKKKKPVIHHHLHPSRRLV